MNLILELLLFFGSCFLLTWLNTHLINSLVRIAKYFGIREFIAAFFIFCLPISLPNLFVDLGAALRGLPQIAIGDMIGGNLVDLTLVVALTVFFSKKYISANNDMVQGSAIFTTFVALFPLLLLSKGSVSRWDGVILIAVFFLYAYWTFSKDNRYKKTYEGNVSITKKEMSFIVVKILAILALLFFVSQQIINTATYFAGALGASLSMVGILIVGLANCFPEMYLSILLIKKGQHSMVFGNIMSSVVGSSTLVFGIVALVHPFVIQDASQILVARIFLVIAAFVFLVSLRSGRRLTKREGLYLLSIYIIFLIVEIFVKI